MSGALARAAGPSKARSSPPARSPAETSSESERALAAAASRPLQEALNRCGLRIAANAEQLSVFGTRASAKAPDLRFCEVPSHGWYSCRHFKLYNKAVQEDPNNGEIYVKRSHANFKLENWEGVVSDVDKAFEQGCKKTAKLLLRKGQALFHLDKYDTAKEVLEEGSQLDGAGSDFALWIEKCSAEIKLIEKAKEAVVVPPTPAKIRYEWYQTERNVTIAVFVKNRKQEDIKAEFTDTAASELHNEASFWGRLRAVTAACTPCHWRADHCEVLPDKVPEAAVVEKAPPVFKTKNWDSIVKETESEKEEGDAALNALFQKIYAEGSDEVKRAMNKSFVESGGTVLSTNWEEIANKTTPIKPPDGMEYRKWTE
ncbi:hypothetical protein HPB50_024437 [Hyalomma asiaticum]|uniref:Uncharacterized protein n=1 Tax=Hyalomma asiaticum TaxID=266040 RepID=A0ACB7SQK5_HYAAI|nr:hypothetical protein HPB50_024437 [Hyalomma asiaticum]